MAVRAGSCLLLVLLTLLVVASACGNGTGREKSPEGPTSDVRATDTPDELLDTVIFAVVRLRVMTRDQAVCVFRDHPSIFQEFVREAGLRTTAVATDEVVKQKAEDLIRRRAVQVDRCFTRPGG